jgi:hypothetical protein
MMSIIIVIRMISIRCMIVTPTDDKHLMTNVPMMSIVMILIS